MAIDLTSNFITINLNVKNMEIDSRFWGKQGDTGRGFDIYLIDNSIIVPTTETVILHCKKPDGTQVWIDGVINENKFKIALTNQVFAVAGNIEADITLISGGLSKTTETFIIQSYSSMSSGAIESINEFGSLKITVMALTSTQRNDVGFIKILGDMIFDVTLNKPIWFNGVNWVDATGTLV